MDSSDSPLVAAVLALVSAATMAWGTALQQRSTQQVPEDTATMQLVWRLAHRPAWWGSVVAIATGFGLYALSLSFGALALVQPLLVTGLVLGSVFSARLAGRRVDRGLLGGGALCCLGLATFLLLARPGGGEAAALSEQPARGPTVVLAVVLAAVVLVAVMAAGIGRGLLRGLALATATGIVFGITATLVKLITDELSRGVVEVLTGWPLWTLCILGPTGFVVSQYAFRYGRLLAPINAVISTLDPVTAVVIGVVALGERITDDPALLTAALVGAAVAVAGILVVSQRGARMLAAYDAARRGEGAGVSTWG